MRACSCCARPFRSLSQGIGEEHLSGKQPSSRELKREVNFVVSVTHVRGRPRSRPQARTCNRWAGGRTLRVLLQSGASADLDSQWNRQQQETALSRFLNWAFLRTSTSKAMRAPRAGDLLPTAADSPYLTSTCEQWRCMYCSTAGGTRRPLPRSPCAARSGRPRRGTP